MVLGRPQGKTKAESPAAIKIPVVATLANRRRRNQSRCTSNDEAFRRNTRGWRLQPTIDAIDNWKNVWARRSLNPAAPSLLAALMAADGHDTQFGDVSETHFRQFVDDIAAKLGIAAGDSVYEVGCGAGAFLYPLAERGVRVGGLDQSAALVGIAREHLPSGTFEVAGASELSAAPAFDAVISCGVFMYFPTLALARDVVERMVRKATRAVAVLDVPDLAQREAAMAMRRGMLGPAEYEARYRGLEHLYYDRAWLRDMLLAAGATRVTIESQSLHGCPNAQHRFNAFAEIAS